jgi:hypothetical protein
MVLILLQLHVGGNGKHAPQAIMNLSKSDMTELHSDTQAKTAVPAGPNSDWAGNGVTET